MAIDYTLIVQGHELTNEMFIHELNQLGMECNEIIKLDKGIEINQFNDIIGLTIYLIDSGESPYNAVDFDFLNQEFKFERSIRFHYNKLFNDSEAQWKAIITIAFTIMSKLKTNAILAFDTDVPYCLFTKNHELFINTATDIYENPYFKKFSKEWRCFNIDKNIIDI